MREIESAVAARHRGDGPRDRPDPSIVKHRLAFDVRAETMALFRDLQATVRADLGAGVEDDAVVTRSHAAPSADPATTCAPATRWRSRDATSAAA